MTHDPHGTESIPVGTPVIDHDGQSLGQVHEVYPHYLLVGQEGQHTDLEVPVHAITGFDGGTLQVSITRSSVTEVDNVETAHRVNDDGHPAH